MNSFECPNCQESLELEDDMYGQEGICPYCNAQITIPALSSEGPPQLASSAPPPVPQQKLEVNRGKTCPNCNASMADQAVLCIQCGHDLRTGEDAPQQTHSSGGYQQPQVNAPGAVSSLICGILGIVCCGLLAFVAIYQGMEARKLCAQNERFTGAGMALAGIILGIIGVVLMALSCFIQLAAAAAG